MDFNKTVQKMYEHRKDDVVSHGGKKKKKKTAADAVNVMGWCTAPRSLCGEFTLMAYLAFPLQLSSEPLKVAVPPLHTRLLQFKDG